MTGELPERKLRHLDACLTRDVQFQTVTTGLEAVPWPYRALPDVNLDDIDLGVTFLGKRLSAPLLIGAMTGGAHIAGTGTITEEGLKTLDKIAEAGVDTGDQGSNPGGQEDGKPAEEVKIKKATVKA